MSGYYKLILILMVVLLTQCVGYRQIQAEMQVVYLDRIESGAYRYPTECAWLIWRDTRRPANEYPVMIRIDDTANYRVGMKSMAVMRR